VSTVYVIGAGASYGDTLFLPSDRNSPGFVEAFDKIGVSVCRATSTDNTPSTSCRPTRRLRNPPLAKGFFDGALLDALDYRKAEQDFNLLTDHIRRHTTGPLSDEFGARGWKTLDIEELLTSIEIEREFNNPESNEGAKLVLVRNELLRYIRQIIAFCTLSTYGDNFRKLKAGLEINDSVITFNWDLLLDQEFIDRYDGAQLPHNQYGNFFRSAPSGVFSESIIPPVVRGSGLFLKLHGSLNWFRCSNYRCQGSSRVDYHRDIRACLPGNDGTTSEIEVHCDHCGTVMNPIMIPPVLHKAIAGDPVIRSAWGLARQVLSTASKVVAVGFSAAPTDFYAAWLLRSTVGTREVELVVVNPSTRTDDKDHCAFTNRMRSIFRQYDTCKKLRCFSEIESVLPPRT
jgi:hypothetical protein